MKRKIHNKHIIVIEDSSKNTFGGGQKVSLLVLSFLKDAHKLILFDTNRKSKFHKEADYLTNKSFTLLKFGSSRAGIIGWIMRFLEYISFPFLLILNIAHIFIKTRVYNSKIVYAATKKSLVIAYTLKVLFNIDFIYHAHLVERNNYLKILINFILKKSKSVISVSNAAKKSISAKNNIVIYNPINSDVNLKSRSLNERIVVAVFASLIKIKGIEYFLRSHKYLKTNKVVEYWIFGEGVEKANLIKYKSERIIFKGFTDSVIDEMKNNINILCFPTIIEEACPMSILEAFSFGIPVVSTNIGGQAELVINGYNGLHVPIKNEIEIAKKIIELIEGNNYEIFSKNAIISVKKYNFDNFENKLKTIV